MSRIVADYHAFLSVLQKVEAALPDSFVDAGSVLISVLQRRWEETEAQDGDTFVAFLRSYADVLAEQGGPAAQPFVTDTEPAPGPETLS